MEALSTGLSKSSAKLQVKIEISRLLPIKKSTRTRPWNTWHTLINKKANEFPPLLILILMIYKKGNYIESMWRTRRPCSHEVPTLQLGRIVLHNRSDHFTGTSVVC